MFFPSTTISELLRSLVPKNQDELVLLTRIVECAERAPRANAAVTLSSAESQRILSLIPEDARRYFHGLAEALEIYQSIHGRAFRPSTLTDASIHTVRQIRDLCFGEESLRAPF